MSGAGGAKKRGTGRRTGTAQGGRPDGLASLSTRKRRAAAVEKALAGAYPDADCALEVRTPFAVLVATILSAQCTDKKVNEVLPDLFARYPDVEAFASAKPEEIEPVIRPIGLYRGKARNLVAAARRIRDDYDGEVPAAIDALVTLPGVGRKTANCVLVNGFGEPGLMCDTHFCRVTGRLGLHAETDPDKIEAEVGRLLPPATWGAFSHRIIAHGRAVCRARGPRCADCVLLRRCPAGKERSGRASET